MRTIPKSAFWIIFGVVFLDLVGFGIVFPLLPLYAREYNMNEFQTGLVLGIYSLMQFIFAPILGKISDKIGRRPVLLISMAGTAISFFMLAWSKSFEWFLLARALDGIAGSNIATAQAYIADISPKKERTKNMGMWIGAAFGLGFAFGPFIGGGLHMAGQSIMPEMALSFPFLAAGLLALVNIGFACFKLPESLEFKKSAHHIGYRTFSLSSIFDRLRDISGFLIITYAIVIFAFSQMESTFSWLASDLFGLDSTGIYMMFGYLGVVMAVVQGGVVRKLASKMGDKKLTLYGCLIMAISLAIIPLDGSLGWLLITTGILATGESFAHVSLISGISKESHEVIQGEAMGVTQSLASLSRFIGPITGGYMYQYYGFIFPYAISAFITASAIFIAFYGYKKMAKTGGRYEHENNNLISN